MAEETGKQTGRGAAVPATRRTNGEQSGWPGEGAGHYNGNSPDGIPRRTILEGFVYYASIVMRHKLLVIGLTGVVALGTVAFMIVSKKLPPDKSPLPNVYTASAELFLQANQGPLTDVSAAFGMNGNQSQSGKGPDYGAIALEVLQSRPFLDSLDQQFNVAQKYHINYDEQTRSRQQVLQHADFNYDATTDILTIQYTDVDPQFAADITNGMVDLLGQWFTSRVSSATMRAEQFVGDKLTQVKDQMSKLQAQLEQFQQKYGVLSVDELSRVRSNILASLRSQLVLIETEIRTRSATSTVQDPTLEGLKSQRSSLLAMIEQVQQGAGGYAGTMPSSTDMPGLSEKMSALNTDMAVQNKIYQTLSQQYELLKLDLQATPMFQVIERADTPRRKSGPSRSVMVVGATAVAFILSVVLSLVFHSIPKARRIYARQWGSEEE